MAKNQSTEMPKSETMNYLAINNGLKGIIDGIDNVGEAFHLEFLLILDGKYYPIKDFLQYRCAPIRPKSLSKALISG
jgi:hypothetical protein